MLKFVLDVLNTNILYQNFVSYAAGAVRLSALSGHQVIWVGQSLFSHLEGHTVTFHI